MKSLSGITGFCIGALLLLLYASILSHGDQQDAKPRHVSPPCTPQNIAISNSTLIQSV
jgi:hypothetical protein